MLAGVENGPSAAGIGIFNCFIFTAACNVSPAPALLPKMPMRFGLYVFNNSLSLLFCSAVGWTNIRYCFLVDWVSTNERYRGACSEMRYLPAGTIWSLAEQSNG